MTKNWRTDKPKLAPYNPQETPWSRDTIQSVTQPKCAVGRTLLTMDWCYTHMRYVINCIDLKLTTEDEVFNCNDDVERDQRGNGSPGTSE